MEHESKLESKKRRSGNKNNRDNIPGLTVVRQRKKVPTKEKKHQVIEWNAPVDNWK